MKRLVIREHWSQSVWSQDGPSRINLTLTRHPTCHLICSHNHIMGGPRKRGGACYWSNWLSAVGNFIRICLGLSLKVKHRVKYQVFTVTYTDQSHQNKSGLLTYGCRSQIAACKDSLVIYKGYDTSVEVARVHSNISLSFRLKDFQKTCKSSEFRHATGRRLHKRGKGWTPTGPFRTMLLEVAGRPFTVPFS